MEAQPQSLMAFPSFHNKESKNQLANKVNKLRYKHLWCRALSIGRYYLLSLAKQREGRNHHLASHGRWGIYLVPEVKSGLCQCNIMLFNVIGKRVNLKGCYMAGRNLLRPRITWTSNCCLVGSQLFQKILTCIIGAQILRAYRTHELQGLDKETFHISYHL